jgi:YVTN family beta-propeller protein
VVEKGMKMKSFALRTLLGFMVVAGTLLIIVSGSPDGQPSRDYFGDNEPVLISPDSPALIRRPAAPEEAAVITEAETKPVYRSPMHVCFSPDGRRAYVVNQTSDSVSVVDVGAREVMDEIPVPPHPNHAALSPDGRTLYVTSLYANALAVLDVEKRRLVRKIETGYGPYGVTVSADGKKLYVANSLSDTLSIIDAKTGETVFETPVGRNPRYVAEARNGARLVVTNGLSRDVSLVDPASGQVLETRKLGEGAIPRQVACSRNGEWSFVVHLVSRDKAIPTQLERGSRTASPSSTSKLPAFSSPFFWTTCSTERPTRGARWCLPMTSGFTFRSRGSTRSRSWTSKKRYPWLKKAIQRRWLAWRKTLKFSCCAILQGAWTPAAWGREASRSTREETSCGCATTSATPFPS